MLVGTKNVRLIMLQFSFSNISVVPPFLKRLNKETLQERTERKERSNGVMIIEPREKCSLGDFIATIEEEFELVDAFCKERIDGKDPRKKRMYQMVRFVFARKEFATPCKEFVEIRNKVLNELRKICESAMWRVRAFRNPFLHDGEVIEDQYAISVNLEARDPLFRPDGSPVTMWRKNKEGQKIGDAPVPIKPNFRLTIEKDALCLAS